jgi:hypothetical protein
MCTFRFLLLSLILTATSSAFAGFLPGKSYTTPGTPVAIAAADLNHDGKIDMVIGDDVGMAIYFGKGDGTWQAPLNIPITWGAYYISIADLNGDGVLDLVTSGGGAPANVAVLLGKPSGGFKAPVFYNVPNTNVIQLALGDMNGDGILDAVLSTSDSDIGNGLAVLPGNGDGTFGTGAAYSALEPTLLVLGDFNRDGHLDVAASDFFGFIDVALGKGDGTLRPVKTFTGAASGAIATVDLNGDGILDLVDAYLLGGRITAELGVGDGTFAPPIFKYTTGVYVRSLVVSDFTGDGIPDIIWIGGKDTAGGKATVLSGVGDGTFVQDGTLPVGQIPDGIVAADFNGDHHMDFAVINQISKSVTVYLNDGQ